MAKGPRFPQEAALRCAVALTLRMHLGGLAQAPACVDVDTRTVGQSANNISNVSYVYFHDPYRVSPAHNYIPTCPKQREKEGINITWSTTLAPPFPPSATIPNKPIANSHLTKPSHLHPQPHRQSPRFSPLPDLCNHSPANPSTHTLHLPTKTRVVQMYPVHTLTFHIPNMREYQVVIPQGNTLQRLTVHKPTAGPRGSKVPR